ncbi:MAG: cobalamin biosynthesis protein CobD [Candidatus Nitrohelix vancouverensis]|uniref:Cobalamin biosynthesis protein CobD n=1 Tax=Candidatus Nitrohelix vancouverensis TaxID=2705534 RepID=A0A7T0C4U8_9BACT|nr:MAG: cobalamin biosynthesis protein CobD [Candidatus Nitrohelix vancouverensis]
MELSQQIFIAFYLDLALGDPRGYPHPVVLIGRFASRLESIFRKRFSNLLFAGALTAVLVVCGAYLSVAALLHALRSIAPLLEDIGSILLIYAALSTRCLFDESRPVEVALKRGRLDEARRCLSYIVGRDTQNMEEPQIIRATVETVAENTSDGVVAPLFYAFIGGAPLAIAYKAVNTLDSQFGYKNERYLLFGRFSARLDDAANWLPARITGALMTLSAFVCGFNGKASATILMRDHANHASPNSGWPEAAVAGALSIQLGGPSSYQGTLLEKPFIGDSLQPAHPRHISHSQKIMLMTATLALAIFFALRHFIQLNF